MSIFAFKPTCTGNFRREEYAILECILGVRVISGADMAALAIERVDVTVIDRLREHGLRADELSFVIPRRTLSHRRQQHQRLSTDESDKAIRLARIIAQATATFGNREKAIEWLRTSHRQFADRTGLDMTSSEHGARLVEEALVQVDEGYFA
ncbi:antitoxin Xre/MbcA/ParS toxin-binding domain-containing protein [Paraburkholderia caribensis]|uniref:antitoxin Xre/MbcA/ParS toxin-binding domain-containing protein n=1 Tax=Paraburkholderia caribensis TaxID=75105 RepID=UPI001D06BA54|nr:antitoxin Xre-like helix-turn-helix domain-containing protein [Paraburkholderia caribensis]